MVEELRAPGMTLEQARDAALADTRTKAWQQRLTHIMARWTMEMGTDRSWLQCPDRKKSEWYLCRYYRVRL